MATLTGETSRIQPAYADYFADPFVWKHQGLYYAVGTGAGEAAGKTVGSVFPILQSQDMAQWHLAGHALKRPAAALGNTFWAPAVAVAGGTFFLYYSVGHGDKSHQLRVACSSTPQGPYEDIGRPLLNPAMTPFAIDPHPFEDKHGRWYLFF